MADQGNYEELAIKYKYYPTYLYYTENAYPNALQLMVEAVSGERHDELFYDYLIREAPDEKQKQIIASIRDDERKHNKMFREIYYQLTHKEIPPTINVTFQRPRTYLVGLEMALFGELGAVEKYRQIIFGLECLAFRNMLYEIITDEQKHANKYNFLYAINYCRPPHHCDP